MPHLKRSPDLFVINEVMGGAVESEIKYTRGGGMFVSKKKGCLFVLIAITFAAIVGILVFLLAPCKNLLRNDLVASELGVEPYVERSHLRLPRYVKPSYYRLKIQPVLNEQKDPFTFNGRVFITLSANEDNVKKIVLHGRGLTIKESGVLLTSVNVASTNPLRAESLIQEVENVPVLSNVTNINNNGTGTSNNTEIANGTLTNGSSTDNIGKESTTTVGTNDVVEASKNLTEVASGGSPNVTEVSIVSSTNATEITSASPTVAAVTSVEASSKASSPTPTTTSTPPTVGTAAATTVLPTVVKHNYPQSIDVFKILMDEKTDRIVLYLSTPLSLGLNYTLEIPFSGIINDSQVGFYKNSYVENNSTKWFVATQFQPTFARKTFPCFDEPEFKAEFEISVARKQDMSSLSNMPLKEKEPITKDAGMGTNWVWDHYVKSPPMATYLVGFMVSEMASTEVASIYPKITIWSQPSFKPLTAYASLVVPKMMKKYEDWFGRPFPSAKLDIAGLPSGTLSTENLGLLFLKESESLIDPDMAKAAVKLQALSTMAYSIAHQWFGDLVTVTWWSEIWLNEGFASFMKYTAADFVEPTWDFSELFSEDIIIAMELDSMKSTFPLSGNIEEPIKISKIVDQNLYKKGSCIIRMINNTFSEKIFMNGVRKYVDKWKYSNANQDEFWVSLTDSIGNTTDIIPKAITVRDIMNSWTTQTGYPVITVTRNYETGDVTIHQAKFSLHNESSDSLWYIPITYTSKDLTEAIKWNSIPQAWMNKDKEIVLTNVTAPGNTTWVVFNDLRTGFYRVNYDTHNWNLIVHLLESSPSTFPSITRAMLLDDALTFAQAGQLEYSTALNVTKYLSTENTYIVWKAALRNFNYIEINMADSIYYGYLQEYLLNLLVPVYEKLETESSTLSVSSTMLRAEIVDWVCSMEHSKCIQWAQGLYNEWATNGAPDEKNPIPTDLRPAVYCTVITRGGKKEWDFIWEMAMATTNQADRLELLRSLTCTTKEWLLRSLLEKTVNGTEIKLQEGPEIWDSLTTPLGVNVGFTFLREHWMNIWEKYSHDTHVLTKVARFMQQLSTDESSVEIEDFVAKHRNTLRSISITMDHSIEQIHLRAEWKTKHIPDIVRWLKEVNMHT